MKNSDCNLWDILAPPDISYFRLPVYQHFSGRAFHIRTVRQELDILPFQVWALHRNQDDRTHAGTVQGLVWTIL